jgi:hypothetical protein
MVGKIAVFQPAACQSLVTSSVPTCTRRSTQRRTVDGSGDRDASATCGIDRHPLSIGATAPMPDHRVRQRSGTSLKPLGELILPGISQRIAIAEEVLQGLTLREYAPGNDGVVGFQHLAKRNRTNGDAMSKRARMEEIAACRAAVAVSTGWPGSR